MRRLGMALMTLGLLAALVALGLGEAFLNSRARPYLDLMFYAGVAMCALGAAVFSARLLIAKYRS